MNENIVWVEGQRQSIREAAVDTYGGLRFWFVNRVLGLRAA